MGQNHYISLSISQIRFIPIWLNSVNCARPFYLIVFPQLLNTHNNLIFPTKLLAQFYLVPYIRRLRFLHTINFYLVI